MPMSDKFPVVDISHKPRRTQADNLSRMNPPESKGEPEKQPEDSQSVNSLESAIKYYKENATGEHARLYKATSAWLTELLERRATPKANNKGDESSEVRDSRESEEV